MSQTRKPAAKKATAKTAASNGQAHNITSLGRRFVLAQVRAEIEEDSPPIEVEGANGTIFTIPTPALWTDEVQRLAGEDPAACQKELLGDQYETWIKQGGTWGILNRIVAGASGADVGKSSAS